MTKASSCGLFGSWESTETFGNTSLDWTQALKDQKALLRVTFEPNFTFSFHLFDAKIPTNDDITNTFHHLFATKGTFQWDPNDPLRFSFDITFDKVGLLWTFQNEEDDTLRIR